MCEHARRLLFVQSYIIQVERNGAMGQPERILALRRGFPRPASGVQAPRPSGGKTEPLHFCAAKTQGSPQRYANKKHPHTGVFFIVKVGQKRYFAFLDMDLN